MSLTAPDWDDRSFPVMGTTARLLVKGRPRGAADAEARLAGLEARWSRFRPDSDVARLNAAPGRPVRVAPETYTLVARAVDAWRRTDGRFDPTGGAAMVALGYDRDFRLVADTGTGAAGAGTRALPGCAGIELDRVVGAVTLPAGVTLDLGGIGKGAAADLVVDELLRAGAEAVCVDLGGDVRVAGPGPVGGVWEIAFDGEPLTHRFGRLRLAGGAVATSTIGKRRWRNGDDEVHHLLDPRTGRPADSGAHTVTVVTGEAWWAEVLAKAALVDGVNAGCDRLQAAGVDGVLVPVDGEAVATDGFRAWCSGPQEVLAGREAAELVEVEERGHAVEHR
jgi:thiamine biosynthesis lipoprotein